VNFLAPFLLTNLLLDRLKESAPARIVNVASAAHARSLAFDNLQGERRYSQMGAYSTSKLALILFTYELARRLDRTRVDANAVHPGGVRTEIYRDVGWLARLGLRLIWPLLRSPEKGAETTVYVATAPELAGVSGRFFADSREGRTATASYNVATARRLWEIGERLVGLSG
jgi:NAD(P)-dependent dehydrogenase (short-subunit alcohol dehydrogenase family)